MKKPEYVKEQITKHYKEILFTHQTISMIHADVLHSAINTCAPIFLVRDPKDTLVSWYFLHDITTTDASHEQIKHRIKGFIMSPFMGIGNKIILWKEQISGFMNYHHSGLVVRYENLIRNYSTESRRISDYLSLQVADSLPHLDQVQMSRKGVIGDHSNYLDNATIDMINEICKEEIAYINASLI